MAQLMSYKSKYVNDVECKDELEAENFKDVIDFLGRLHNPPIHTYDFFDALFFKACYHYQRWSGIIFNALVEKTIFVGGPAFVWYEDIYIQRNTENNTRLRIKLHLEKPSLSKIDFILGTSGEFLDHFHGHMIARVRLHEE
jgi:hypothetical protein